MSLTRIIAPTVTPLSLEEVKDHLRVSGTDQDDMIQLYLDAATDYADGEWGWFGRCLVTQTWRLTLDEFPTAEIKIPLPPLQSIVQVAYDDSAGIEQIVSSSDYYIDSDSEPGWLMPLTSVTWPTPLDAVNAVRIDFVAGYPPEGSPPDLTANIPANIKQGLLLLIGEFMESRRNVMTDPVNVVPFATEMLWTKHKIDVGFA